MLARGGPRLFTGDREARPPKSDMTPVPEPPLGGLLAEIRRGELSATAEELEAQSKIQNCRLVASFNWMDSREPTVLIPGGPAQWLPLKAPITLEEDTTLQRRGRKFYRDKNGARFPDHPMEPALMVALNSDPHLPDLVDLVACGSTLGNLLRFARGRPKSFRFLVEVVARTVFFVRRENSPIEEILDIHGYGHTFPEASTTWSKETKGSVSHQRLIQYDFCGQRILVRYEGDGYIPRTDTGSNASKAPPDSDDGADIEDLLGNLKTGWDYSVQSDRSSDTKLRKRMGGRVIPQADVFDLKTRSIKRKGEDFLDEELPRLWIAQIPNFILAFHHRGMFQPSETTVRDVRDDVATWEKNHRDELALFGALVNRILSFARKEPSGKVEVRCDGLGALEVREQLDDAGDLFSAEGLEAWLQAKGSPAPDIEDQDDIEYDDQLGYDSHDQFAGSDLENYNGESDDEDKDFTACSADDCGYCGRCMY